MTVLKALKSCKTFQIKFGVVLHFFGVYLLLTTYIPIQSYNYVNHTYLVLHPYFFR